MYILSSLLLLIIAAILQLTNIFYIKSLNTNPNFIFILIIILTLFFGFRRTFWLALLGGFLMDLHNYLFGFFMVFFILAAFFTDLFSNYILIKKPIIVLIIINLIFTIFYFFLNSWLIKNFLFNDKFLFNIIYSLIYNSFLIIILYPLLNIFKEKIYYYENKKKLPL